MNFEDKIARILDQESARTQKFSNEINEISAWSQNSWNDTVKNHSLTLNITQQRPVQKLEKKLTRTTHIDRRKLFRDHKEEKKISIQNSSKYSTPFSSYINTLRTRNSHTFRTYENPLNTPKKLEVISIKLLTNQDYRRLKTTSPERTRIRNLNFIGDNFLIYKKSPPVISGSSMIVHAKSIENKARYGNVFIR